MGLRDDAATQLAPCVGSVTLRTRQIELAHALHEALLARLLERQQVLRFLGRLRAAQGLLTGAVDTAAWQLTGSALASAVVLVSVLPRAGLMMQMLW